MPRNDRGQFVPEPGVNQNALNIARAKAGNYRQALAERAETGRREAEKPDYLVNLPGTAGEIARQQRATRLQAFEEAVAELERFDGLSDAELVAMFCPESSQPAEPVNFTETLARGRMVSAEDNYAPGGGYAGLPGDYTVGVR